MMVLIGRWWDFYRLFVGTWNVGGKSPHWGLNLTDWLGTPSPADIYVLGFQEIVPLNAGNVLGAEDNGPAAKWLTLIQRALNINTNDPQFPHYLTNATNSELEQSPPASSTQNDCSEEVELNQESSFEPSLSSNSNSNSSEEGSPSAPCRSMKLASPKQQHQFCLAASKQMVGIFLSVWVRSDFNRYISNLKVSRVGRGLMGFLGNKGSIAISMTLHQTTFCFVCTHLASGEKEGDEVKRNSDVMEILKKTKFSHPCRVAGEPVPPESILDHDNVIWLGDLNYRLASNYWDTHELLQKNDWQALLEKDQLRIEQKAGHVFKGWEEGGIYFAPTYKYVANSDHYVIQTSSPKQKQRTPAWCDRILWKGEGLKQMWYVRGESKFSDHKPVCSLFSVQVNVANKNNPKPVCSNTPVSSTIAASLPPSRQPIVLSGVVKVQAEELLLHTMAQSCIQSTPMFSSTAQKVTSPIGV
ncbi:unnamed protein product [Ilex paraguariensis]|uniref:Inositol polyphosphate-related phosphatase domain-containing protein n=1 Tax=Ilex paraguariensis TaxID=185542 RepID=A0ABC8UI84_9AQUA